MHALQTVILYYTALSLQHHKFQLLCSSRLVFNCLYILATSMRISHNYSSSMLFPSKVCNIYSNTITYSNNCLIVYTFMCNEGGSYKPYIIQVNNYFTRLVYCFVQATVLVLLYTHYNLIVLNFGQLAFVYYLHLSTVMASRSIKGAASNIQEAECECSSTLCLHPNKNGIVVDSHLQGSIQYHV